MSLPIQKRQVISSLIEDGVPPSTFTIERRGRSKGRKPILDLEELGSLDDPDPIPTQTPAQAQIPVHSPTPIVAQPTTTDDGIPILRAAPITVPKPQPKPTPMPAIEEEDEDEQSRETPQRRKALEEFTRRAKKRGLVKKPDEAEMDESEESAPGLWSKVKSSPIAWIVGGVGLYLLTGNRAPGGAAPAKAADNLWE